MLGGPYSSTAGKRVPLLGNLEKQGLMARSLLHIILNFVILKPNKEHPIIIGAPIPSPPSVPSPDSKAYQALNNPLPLIINPPTPLIINTPQIWYTMIYCDYLLLGGWGGLLLGGGDYSQSIPAYHSVNSLD